MAKKPRTNATNDQGNNIDSESWSYISGLATRRRAQKVKLTDLIENRKSLEEQLKEEGPKHTKKRLELSADYVDVLERIDLARAKLKELADKLEKAIDDANQGKLPGMADDGEDAPKTDSDLYNRASGRDGGEPETAGRIGTRNGEHATAETGA